VREKKKTNKLSFHQINFSMKCEKFDLIGRVCFSLAEPLHSLSFFNPTSAKLRLVE